MPNNIYKIVDQILKYMFIVSPYHSGSSGYLNIIYAGAAKQAITPSVLKKSNNIVSLTENSPHKLPLQSLL
jgi:hypothetical protein